MSIILKSKLFIVVCLLFTSVFIRAQYLDKTYFLLDSLIDKEISPNDKAVMNQQLKIYHESKTDTSKAIALNEIVENVQDEKIWVRYNEIALKFARECQKRTAGKEFNEHRKYEALAINNVGYYINNYTDNLDSAILYYKEALGILNSIKKYEPIITCYSNIGNALQNKGNLLDAMEYYNKAIDLSNKISNKEYLLAPLNNLAQIYVYVGDTAKALLNLKKCLSLSISGNDKNMMAHLLHNIGLISAPRDPAGIQSTLKALHLREEIGDKKGITQTLLSLAGYYSRLKDFNKTLAYLNKAKPYLEQSKNKFQQSLYHSTMMNYHFAMQDTAKGIQQLEMAYEIHRALGAKSIEYLSVVKELIHLCKDKPAYTSKLLNYYESYYLLENTMEQKEMQKRTMQKDYEESLKIQQTEFKAQQAIAQEKNKSEKKRQQYVIFGVSIILIIVLIFSFFLFKAFTRIKKSNQIISLQKQEVEKQKHIIEEKHKDITDSITYAHRIQSALIPDAHKLQLLNKNISILFTPRDIVSGDFYWYSRQTHYHVFALADCTGHGVPGAFMSIIGLNLLNTLVNEKDIGSPQEVLKQLKTGVIASLNTNSAELDKRDGMDMALIYFNDQELRFAGANQSIYILRNQELIEYKGNKQPIGLSEKDEAFTELTIPLNKKDRIFMLSDGLADQFGGKEGKKLKIKKLREWFIETAQLSLHEQKKAIAEKLDNFKAGFEQTDDITLAIIEV